MYVALKRMRFGEAHLKPGDEVPDEPGRNYNLMLRQGLIADVDAINQSEEQTRTTQDGLKARISNLELALAEAHAEIKEHREARGLEPLTADEAASTEMAEELPEDIVLDEETLKEMSKDQLVELLGGREVAKSANKATIIEVLTSPSTKEE